MESFLVNRYLLNFVITSFSSIIRQKIIQSHIYTIAIGLLQIVMVVGDCRKKFMMIEYQPELKKQ